MPSQDIPVMMDEDFQVPNLRFGGILPSLVVQAAHLNGCGIDESDAREPQPPQPI